MADVSVIIPCYNAERFIADTLRSVLEQTEPVREVLVIDDGSTDGSAAIVAAIAAEAAQIRLIRQRNAGESTARNVGLTQARGAFIALLDADDLWLPEKTARQLEVLQRFPDAVATHCRVFNFEQTLDDSGRSETERSKDDPSVADLIAYHYVCPSTVLIRREAIERGGLRFDESTRHSEDMLFMADLRMVGPLRWVDAPLVAKRVHAGQQTRDPWHPLYSAESRVGWVRRRAGVLGAEQAAAMEAALGAKLVEFLERRYWSRQLADYRELRDRVAALCPQAYRGSSVAGRRIYPAWVYRLRDRFTGKAGNAAR